MSTSSSSSQRPKTKTRVERVEASLRSFEKLKANPKFSEFFSFTFPDMKVGKLIKKMGLSTLIFEGEFTLMQRKFPCALKLTLPMPCRKVSWDEPIKRFPDALLTGGSAVFPGFPSGTSSVLGGLILENGQYAGCFAIVLRRVWGTLEDLIKLRRSKFMFLGISPFKDACAKKIMLEIAIVLQQLHSHGILHRDLTSANVMVCTNTSSSTFHEDLTTPLNLQASLLPNDIEDDAFHVTVIDFESSVGVNDISTYQAPEVHRQWQELKMKNRQHDLDAIVYTNKSDVYSYAFTCYHILTGQLPFQQVKPWERDLLRNGSLKPKLPQRMDEWLRDLIEKCWHQDPSQRPEFEEIVHVFNSKLLDTTTYAVKQEVETSKSHWSETPNSHGQDDLQEETNRQIFENLKQHPEFSNFFSYTFRNLNPGRKIAEGGQAKIFEADFEKENGVKVPCVVKLFKHMSLRDMVKEWPSGMLRSGDSPGHLRFGFMGLLPGATRTCEVLGAMVDENDDFAFIFNREGGDLRRLIEHRMRQPSTHSRPFKLEFAKRVMYEIALGMQHLHDRGILHRDLKAANVLVTNAFGEFPSDAKDELIAVKVADFECSMLVKGTRFWRAPEILQQIREQIGSEMVLTFTREFDVYSYGMTCYEVLTGGIPLEHLARNDYAAVCVRGERPALPRGWLGALVGRYLRYDISGGDPDYWLKTLIENCWDAEPSKRPTFKDIVEEFERNCPALRYGHSE